MNGLFEQVGDLLCSWLQGRGGVKPGVDFLGRRLC